VHRNGAEQGAKERHPPGAILWKQAEDIFMTASTSLLAVVNAEAVLKKRVSQVSRARECGGQQAQVRQDEPMFEAAMDTDYMMIVQGCWSFV
jgi:hypothetical protein